MDHARGVRNFQRVTDLLGEADHAGGAQRAGFLDVLLERRTRDVLEYEVRTHLIGLSNIVHLHDVGMLKSRCGPRFVAEPLEEELQRVRLHVEVSDRLDRHGAIQVRVAPEIHESHGARSEQSVHRVSPHGLGDAVVHPADASTSVAPPGLWSPRNGAGAVSSLRNRNRALCRRSRRGVRERSEA